MSKPKQSQSVVVSGVELDLTSTMSPERLQFFRCTNPAQNTTPRKLIALADVLAQIPKFSNLMIFAAPGTFQAGPLLEGSVELSLLLKEGAGADDELNLFLFFPGAGHDVMNGGLLMKQFGISWDRGLSQILLDAYHDGRPPLLTLAEAPSVHQTIEASAKALFGPFVIKGEIPEVDPFAQPVGLPDNGRLIGDSSHDPNDL